LIYDGVAYEKEGQSFGDITSGGVYGQTHISGVTFTLDDSGVEGGSNHRAWTAGEMAVARYVTANYRWEDTLFNMTALSQTSVDWSGMCAAPNGDVYACVYAGMGDGIYKQSCGVGDFVPLPGTGSGWTGMCAAPNGDVYACQSMGVYKQSGGVGDFVSIAWLPYGCSGMCAAPNGDIYVCVNGEDIYKQSGGVGNFVALSQTSRAWSGMCAAPNGDVYACAYDTGVYDRGICKQSGGVGNFILISNLDLHWSGMCATPYGDVYVCASEENVFKKGDIYVQDWPGQFSALNQGERKWSGMCAAPNGEVYACVSPDFIAPTEGDIYKHNLRIFFTAPYDGVARVHHSHGGYGVFTITIDGTPYAVSSGTVPEVDAIPVPLLAGQELMVTISTDGATMFYLPSVYP